MKLALSALRSITFTLIILLPAPIIARQTVPRFDPTPCPVVYPVADQVKCGLVTVPEQHAQPDGPTIQIAVAIFPAQTANPLPDPVITLSGGPGQNSLAGVQAGLGSFSQSARRHRDLIIFDQRGMGASLPSLACPEVDASKRRTTFEAGSTSDPLEVEAARQCLDRLTAAGVNIAAFNTVESAADIPDIITALGYDIYNVWGGSYGSTLGLTLMRNHPDRIRSVTLTSITPPQVDLMASFSTNVQHNLDLLTAQCAADSACADAFPHFDTLIEETITRLNQQPVTVTTVHPLTQLRTTFTLNGDDLVPALTFMMYNPDSMATIPLFLTSLQAGQYTVLEQLIQVNLSQSETNTDGALYAMRCMDDVLTTTPAAWQSAIATVSPVMQPAWLRSMNWWYEICGMGWGAQTLPPVENTPITSPIPIFLQSGELDPVTPPAWGDLALQTLPNGYHAVYPASAHNAAPTTCALRMFTDFLENPAAPPGDTCIANPLPPPFVIP